MATEKIDAWNVEDDNEGQEDEKMEQFFALIRDFQEARNRRKDELLRLREEATVSDKKKHSKIRRLNNIEPSSWVPSFELTDFTAEIEFRRPHIIFPIPYNNNNLKDDEKEEQHKKQQQDDGLDLKLTL